MASELVGVPEGGELWKVGNGWWVVYNVPGSNPPVPLAWRVKDTASVLPPDTKPEPARRFKSKSEAAREGMLDMGTDAELAQFESDPFETFVQDYEEQAQALPMLQDPEVMALFAGALLEGRKPTPEELSQTGWWQNRSEAQREWATLSLQDPETAKRNRADMQREVEAELRQRGIDAPDGLVKLLTDKWSSGKWTESMTKTQIQGLADPYSGIELSPAVIDQARRFNPRPMDERTVEKGESAVRERVKAIFDNRGADAGEHLDGSRENPNERIDRIAGEIMSGDQTFEGVRHVANQLAGLHPAAELDITREGEEAVRQQMLDWLGPSLAGQFGDRWVRDWAGKLRNDPDAEEELTDKLRSLRKAAFPEWEDENLRYSDVAANAKQLFQQVWQETPDETDPLFMDVLRQTGPGGDGMHAAAAKLRREGLKRKKQAVVQDVSAGIDEATGGSVRQSVI